MSNLFKKMDIELILVVAILVAMLLVLIIFIKENNGLPFNSQKENNIQQENIQQENIINLDELKNITVEENQKDNGNVINNEKPE